MQARQAVDASATCSSVHKRQLPNLSGRYTPDTSA